MQAAIRLPLTVPRMGTEMAAAGAKPGAALGGLGRRSKPHRSAGTGKVAALGAQRPRGRQTSHSPTPPACGGACGPSTRGTRFAGCSGRRPARFCWPPPDITASAPHAAGHAVAPGEQRRRLRRAHRPSAVQWEDPATATLTAERSTLINKEVVLFLFQLEMDSQLQRALTYERFDMAQEVRTRREQVDAALGELQQLKGPSCGARVAGGSGQMEFAPQIMILKAQMAEAVEAEQYAEAAALRDRLRTLEAAAAKAAEAAAQFLCPGGGSGRLLGALGVHASSPACVLACMSSCLCLLPSCPSALYTVPTATALAAPALPALPACSG